MPPKNARHSEGWKEVYEALTEDALISVLEEVGHRPAHTLVWKVMENAGVKMPYWSRLKRWETILLESRARSILTSSKNAVQRAKNKLRHTAWYYVPSDPTKSESLRQAVEMASSEVGVHCITKTKESGQVYVTLNADDFLQLCSAATTSQNSSL